MGNVSTPVTDESVCMLCQSGSGFVKSLCNLLLGLDIYTKYRNAWFLTISVGALARQATVPIFFNIFSLLQEPP